MKTSSKHKKPISIILRLIVAIIFIISGVNKIGNKPEAIELFKQLGAEPWGRYLLGTVDLIVAIMIAFPKTMYVGAALSTMIMIGAIGTHIYIFKIGMDSVVLAIIAFVASIGVLLQKSCCGCCGTACGSSKGSSSKGSTGACSTSDRSCSISEDITSVPEENTDTDSSKKE